MTALLLRGRLLSFVREPQGPDDHSSYRYEEDGGLLMEHGEIAAFGPFDAVKAGAGEAEVVDHRPHLIVPGFIDCHAHFPQMQVIASFGAELLDWLENYTFPEETRFVDGQHAHRVARMFLDELIRQGTTTVAAYCSVHPGSVDALFAEAASRDMRIIAGKVMMDRNAPEGLTDTPQSSYDDTRGADR